jgi:hypothetical protein
MTSTRRTNSGDWLVVLAAVVVLVGGSAYDFYAFSTQGNSATTASVTMTTTATNSGSEVTSSLAQYTVNGLTCPIPGNASLAIISLISKVTTDSRFISATNGSRYVFGNLENYGVGTQIIGGNRTVAGRTVYQPPGTELVFYNYGPNTACQDIYTYGGDSSVCSFAVHVPIEGGQYNWTGMTVGRPAPEPCTRPLATVTVTATLTTQASQATTTYAIPTTSCAIMRTTVTTTTTITVGPTPPASTTTVTTTSTSYTKTVTVTSCTYIVPTVTSTVTTTVLP